MSKPLDLVRLGPDDARPEFSCGDPELDEFYAKDSIDGSRQLMSVTYLVLEEGNPVAFFCVSNDSIRRKDVPEKPLLRRFLKNIPQNKRYAALPAAKIGRLGISKNLQKAGIGSVILDFMKGWFTIGNKTGCRFLVVDAYNTEKVIHFYQKNGFLFLTKQDETEDTRIMYYVL